MLKDSALLREKIQYVFTNFTAFMVYIYEYLNETKYWYPLCDQDE